ncbi:hypothetical protein E4U22_001786, partial [Claviceps purpurea]
MLAGLVYCVWVISLELLLPCKDRALQGGPEIQNFFEQRKEYLQDGSMSVLSCMISLLAYGKRIAMEYGNAGPPVLSSMAMRFPKLDSASSEQTSVGDVARDRFGLLKYIIPAAISKLLYRSSASGTGRQQPLSQDSSCCYVGESSYQRLDASGDGENSELVKSVAKEGDGILQQFQETEERERQIQEGERQNRKRKRRDEKRQRRDEKRQRRDQQGERQAEKKKKMLQQERDKTLEQAQEGEGAMQQERDRALQQAKERERSLQQERDRALQQAEARDRQYQELAKVLQQAYERERQVKEIAKALEDVHEKRRQFQEMATAVLQDQAIASALQKAKERERQAEKRETALQQERDKALQQAQNGERQALETARELREERLRASQLERERDSALQLVQKKDLALQASTLDEYVKECHGSLFSKLTIHPEAQHGRDATTAD